MARRLFENSVEGDLRAMALPLGYQPPEESKEQNTGGKRWLKTPSNEGLSSLKTRGFQAKNRDPRFSGTRSWRGA
jgi:hypothetical protein